MARRTPRRRRPFRGEGAREALRMRRAIPPVGDARGTSDGCGTPDGPAGSEVSSSEVSSSGVSGSGVLSDGVPAGAVPSGDSPAGATPTDPRVTALLGEIAELRLSAATHLTVAAAAMDAGRPDIAAELIEAQQRDVARLRIRAEELLHVEGETGEQVRRAVASAAVLEESELLHTASTPATKSLRRTPRHDAPVALLPRRPAPRRASQWSATGALLAVAAAVVVAVARPLGPPPTAPDPQEISASVVASLDANVARSYDQLQEAASPKGPRLDVEQATARLHADLRRLLPMAAKDPEAAKRVLAVLAAERSLLAGHAPAALAGYTAEATRILTRLRELATPDVLAILPQLEEIVPQAALASDDLPRPAQRPAAVPAPPAAAGGSGDAGGATSGGGTAGTGGGQAPAQSGSGGGDAPPAPVVVLPELPQLPQLPVGGTGNDGGDTSGGTGGGGTGAGTGTGGGDTTTGGTTDTGSDATGLQLPLPLPLPQLPAPPAADVTTN